MKALACFLLKRSLFFLKNGGTQLLYKCVWSPALRGEVWVSVPCSVPSPILTILAEDAACISVHLHLVEDDEHITFSFMAPLLTLRCVSPAFLPVMETPVSISLFTWGLFQAFFWGAELLPGMTEQEPAVTRLCSWSQWASESFPGYKVLFAILPYPSAKVLKIALGCSGSPSALCIYTCIYIHTTFISNKKQWSSCLP